MATESKAVMIVPLNGSNYPTWKLQCKMTLIRDGVWDIVNEKETAPEDITSDAYTKYSSRKNRALATIVLSIDPALLYLVGDPDNPVVVWKKLSNQFQKKTWANKLRLRKRLHSLHLKEGDAVQDYIKSITEIFNELSIVGDEISDEDRVVYLLTSLPDSFNTLVTALEAGGDIPNMEVVTERLLHEESKRRERHHSATSTGTEGAMTARQRTKNRGPRCYNCQQYGHIQRNCPQDQQRFKSEERSRKSSKGVRHKVNQIEARETESDSDVDTGLVTRHKLNSSTGGIHVDQPTSCWIIDSGATCHICHERELFVDFKNLQEKQKVILGDGRSLEAVGIGTVELELVLDNDISRRCEVHSVLYVPGLSYNLLSVARITDRGKRVKFLDTRCEVIDKKERVIAIAIKRDGLYYLSVNRDQLQFEVNMTKQSNENEMIWHQRFGHLCEKSLQQLVKEGLTDGLNYDISKGIGFCKTCVQGKIHRSHFPTTGRKRGNEPLSLIHSDVCGKMNVKSLGGAEYFVTFIDDKTHFTWVYVIKHKDEVFQKFCEWKVMVEKSTGYKVKILRTDNGGEFTSTEFKRYLKGEGIRHELTIPKTPQQNGVAERMNRTLLETVRSMLLGANMPQRFWAEALSTAVYLRNCSPTKAVSNMTPYEAWYGEKPQVTRLRVFGCTAYAHIAKDERRKLDSKAKKCILLGYGSVTKGYCLFDIKLKRVIHSRDVIFDETTCGFIEDHPNTVPESPMVEVQLQDNEDNINQEEPAEIQENVGEPRENGGEIQENANEDSSSQVPSVRRSERVTRLLWYMGQFHTRELSRAD